MADINTPVLIAGGSLVGLSAAMLLGQQGIGSLVVERHRGTAIHPRAAQINQRTMEIFREAGLEPNIVEQSAAQFVQEGAVMAVETLAGKELQWFIPHLNAGVEDISPVRRLFITQNVLEPLLRARAEALGAELRFGWELVGFEQDSDSIASRNREQSGGVTALVCERDSGRRETVRAQYLIAADGSHSRVRQQLGIGMRGRGVFSKSITIHFRADVGPLLRGRNLSVIYVFNPVLSGFFRFEIPFDRGFLAVHWLGDPEHPVTDLSHVGGQRCLELLYAALGAEIPAQIESVMHWDNVADVAERFQDGRVFLAGDAAHTMPPNGGFGGNTGVQDAHNLAWKLAMAARGMAGPKLLATYEAERRPVALFTTEQAYSRYVTRAAPYLLSTGIEPLENDLDIELGYRYGPGAVITEGGVDGRLHENPRESKGRPGTRAPHVWLEEGRKSTLDCFGKNFVLITGPHGKLWENVWREAADKRRIPFEEQLLNERGAEAYGIEPDGAALVRPDGFIAWRARDGGEVQAEAAARLIHELLQ